MVAQAAGQAFRQHGAHDRTIPFQQPGHEARQQEQRVRFRHQGRRRQPVPGRRPDRGDEEHAASPEAIRHRSQHRTADQEPQRIDHQCDAEQQFRRQAEEAGQVVGGAGGEQWRQDRVRQRGAGRGQQTQQAGTGDQERSLHEGRLGCNTGIVCLSSG
jgi:hypothetical protein